MGNQKARAEAAMALRYLAQSSKNQEMIRAEGGIQVLIKVLAEGGPDPQRKAVESLFVYLTAYTQNQAVICDGGGIQVLATMLSEGTMEAQAEAADALLCLAQDPRGRYEVVKVLVEALQSASQEAQVRAAASLQALAHRGAQNQQVRQFAG
eukprot:gnl/TRDRNA2_/TRDRNA2_77965_c0_seq1.p1 gnl/TRDRNA2_/TRDRNA2_77965_c0~~gnl/TRDRNA2_/TRDRNA2_77965_c0_seq1.p1  ORF type:complete len:152 (-),score=29.61 gnl/TRDRNA2_/TRDRNA2_77965_c0_seq1:1-456(-)